MQNDISGNWPFDDDPDTAAITVRSVLEGWRPVLHVFRSDEGWSFEDGIDSRVEDGRVVELELIVRRDPTLMELHDLPFDWVANRLGVDEPWIREPAPRELLD